MQDPIRTLSHDHTELNRRVLDVVIAVGAVANDRMPATLVAMLADLRDMLFLHFAREEEGLFPFVVDTLPELASRVSEMETSHDAICGALSRMYELARGDAPLSQLVALLPRFQRAFTDHARVEAEVLSTLERRLVAGERARLGALVAGV